MKAGDKTDVTIGAHTVAQAEVKEVNVENNTVTLVVPATLVVMGLATGLTDLPNTTSGDGTETIITGVAGPEGPVEAPPVVVDAPSVEPTPAAPVAAPVTPVEAPAVVETPASVEAPATVETPAPVVEAPAVETPAPVAEAPVSNE